MKLSFIASAAVVAVTSSVVHAYDNGMAALPPLGWATWCTDDLCGLLDLCFEEEIHEIADAMASQGMVAIGYNHSELFVRSGGWIERG